MNSVEKINTRRSIRKYKDEPVPEEVMHSILEAGRLSPSAVNRQPWHFVVVKDQKIKEAIYHERYSRFIKDADFTVVGLYLPSEALTEKLSLVDVTIALQSMVIAAWMQDIGSCWIGGFNEEKLKKTLNLPEESKIVCLVSFGVPDEEPAQRPKKSMNEIIHYDKW